MPSFTTLPAAQPDASVSSSHAHKRASLTAGTRWAMASLGLALACLLVVARGLEPDRAGYGTHRQLGFAECGLIRMFDQPCPSCGMTTAWAWLVRGELAQAAAANFGGLLLGLLAVGLCPWLIASAAIGRWCGFRPTGQVVFAATSLFILITLFDWVRRCWISQWL